MQPAGNDNGQDDRGGGAPAPRRARTARFAWRCTVGLCAGTGFLALVAAVLLGLVVLGMTGGRSLPVPGTAVDRIEARINTALDGAAGIRVADAQVRLAEDGRPGVRLSGLELLGPAGAAIAALPDLRATFDPVALRRGDLVPRSLRIAGAQLTLRRDVSGAVDLGFAGGVAMQPVRSLGEFLDAVDAVFDLPVLRDVERIAVSDLAVTLVDARAGRRWSFTDGALTLARDAGEVTLDVELALAGRDGSAPATAALYFTKTRGRPEARAEARLQGISAADIAAQDPGLRWLRVVDAPIDGSFSVEIDAQGRIGPVHGDLVLDGGALRPGGGTPAVPFDRAELGLDFDPESERISLGRIVLRSAQVRLTGTGKIYPEQPGVMTGGALPSAFLGQFRLRDVAIDPEGVFAEPVEFDSGVLDMRLHLSPLRVDLGQLQLLAEPGRLTARGRATARPGGWEATLDMTLDEIAHDRLLALWPTDMSAPTRGWVARNISNGVLTDVTAGLRLRPGAAPEVALSYAFRDATARVLRSFPPIEGAAGYASAAGRVFSTTVTAGRVAAPRGGSVDVAGSTFRVPDITRRPGLGEVALRTDSSITAALSLIDLPPFRFMEKAGREVDIASGRARLSVDVEVPLQQGAPPGSVVFSAEGTLEDVQSETLVPGRVLAADTLDLSVGGGGAPGGIEIGGAGTLSGVPFAATWEQAFGPDVAGSRVFGSLELSPRFSEAFSLGLPAGMLSGAAEGAFDIALPRDAPPEFTLRSDLAGLGLRLANVGWSKAPRATGTLEVAGTLGAPGVAPAVDRLSISAPGLAAEGAVALREGGGLSALRFSRVRLGGWLDAPVTLRPQGGALGVELGGGTLRLGALPDGLGQGGGGGNVPLDVALDRVEVSDGIALTGLAGQFSTGGGFRGQFRAQVNGGPTVEARLVPSGGRVAVQISGADAGAVLRAAGVVRTARGGTLDLVLQPAAQAGSYDGRLTVTDTRVVDAPVLAALLNAISVVGLLERLGGEGLAFSDVSARFRLTPDTIEITEGSAVGASLGVSMSGTYGLRSRRLAFQGVFSPVYMLNSIGSFLTRRGEGLFGFNYAVRGTADAPQVSVNPLSIFTPSMFRELFRRAPPQITQ